MAELIVGHTEVDAATIWVRAGRRSRARITLDSGDGSTHSADDLELAASTDFTGAKRIDGLDADTLYDVSLELRSWRGWVVERRGRVRTFPEHAQPFSFIHGSCNLSIVSLTNLGGLAIGALGSLAGARSMEERENESRPGLVWRRLRRIPKWLLSVASKALFWLIMKTTGYRQPAPLLPSPYTNLLSLADPTEAGAAAFVIHAGDQIYYDFPFPNRAPQKEAYRRAYRETWFEDAKLREFLAQCPHYMTLDDHEIVDGFPIGLDEAKRKEYLEHAIDAYREYVHARHPDADSRHLYYDFEHSGVHFFVLDVRSERDLAKGRMLGPDQMRALEGWLLEHRQALKFVVSGVPFVAELRPAAGPNGDDVAPPAEPRDDKWCGRYFREQRERLIKYVHEKEIERVVFLVGDLHCSYHASMRIGPPESRVTVHELAGGPINQLQFTRRRDFYDHYRGKVADDLPFSVSLESYHGSAAGVLRVSVSPGERPRIGWEIHRTRTRSDTAEEKALEPVQPLFGEIQLL